MDLRHPLITACKGFGMGAANVVPGVSGGTVALLTGIFGELVGALNAILDLTTWKMLFRGDFRGFWARIHGSFLLWLAIGVVLSIFTLARLVTWTLAHHPVQTWAFFFGLIAASAVYLLREAGAWRWQDAAGVAAGICLGILVSTLSPARTPEGLGFVFLSGAVAICTMILPGISGSFILVILGQYDAIMEAVGTLDWPVLGVFAAGALCGLLAFAKFLHWLLERYERPTMLVLTGFVIGSLVKVWPWADRAAIDAANLLTGTPGALHIPGAILWCLAGIALVVALEGLAARSRPKSA